MECVLCGKATDSVPHKRTKGESKSPHGPPQFVSTAAAAAEKPTIVSFMQKQTIAVVVSKKPDTDEWDDPTET